MNIKGSMQTEFIKAEGDAKGKNHSDDGTTNIMIKSIKEAITAQQFQMRGKD